MESERVNRMTEHGCFGCGEANPIGLRLAFYRRGEAVEAAFAARPEHEGYSGFVHGGILATLCDEAMSWAVIAHTKRLMVTARMEIVYRQAVRVGQALLVRGWVEQNRGRVVRARAELRNAVHGAVLVEASGLFLRAPAEQERAWWARYAGGDVVPPMDRAG
ncbi:MAG: PaaI family thioesterase [Thermomicrobium sp.]|nr:PaaI family thioesterase [Thermomicrobium sp.]MDW7981245.1 PaaI family thioesterase [Thermomicrobium sp.]